MILSNKYVLGNVSLPSMIKNISWHIYLYLIGVIFIQGLYLKLTILIPSGSVFTVIHLCTKISCLKFLNRPIIQYYCKFYPYPILHVMGNLMFSLEKYTNFFYWHVKHLRSHIQNTSLILSVINHLMHTYDGINIGNIMAS